LCILGLLEIIFYSLNENIGGLLGITDVGGTMVVHMFGAYFGMAASIAIRSQHHDEHPKNASVYQSDMFAMIGTVFLWMFWPSFNGALATGAQQQRVVLNTFISLCGSCVVSFVTSTTFRKEKKFSMVDVQNATLAGGVAMGTSADLLIGPGAALLVGCTAGLVSTLGYIYVQPALESCIGFYDTCGVNNLHGMPAIIGATAGVIASTQATASRYGPVQLSLIFDKVAEGRTPAQQAINQLVFMCITLVLSLFSGGITGVLIKHVLPSPEEKDELFTDEPFWIMPDVEEPKEKGPARGSFRGSESKRLAQLESQIVALKTQLDGALKQQ